jgi:hypothetical protein
MDKRLIESLEAMAAALTTVGGEARQILADHPLTDKEAAEAEKEGLTHLEYRLAHELCLLEEYSETRVAEVKAAEAEGADKGRLLGQATTRAKARKTNPFTRAQVREALVHDILAAEKSKGKGIPKQAQKHYKAVVPHLTVYLKVNRSYFSKELGKKAIMAEVDLRRDKA